MVSEADLAVTCYFLPPELYKLWKYSPFPLSTYPIYFYPSRKIKLSNLSVYHFYRVLAAWPFLSSSISLFLSGVYVENGSHCRLKLLQSMAWIGKCSMFGGRNSLEKVEIVISLQGTETLYAHARTCGMENQTDLTKYRKSVGNSACFTTSFIPWSRKVPIVMDFMSFFS